MRWLRAACDEEVVVVDVDIDEVCSSVGRSPVALEGEGNSVEGRIALIENCCSFAEQSDAGGNDAVVCCSVLAIVERLAYETLRSCWGSMSRVRWSR